MKLIIKEARLSFSQIYTAKSSFDGDPKFSCCLLINPDTPEGKENLTKFKEVCVQLEKEKFGGKALPTDKYPLKKGEGKYDGWEDPILVLSAASKKRPQVVNQRRETVADGDIDAPQSGDYVGAVLDVWAMDGKFGQRICASLEAIQLQRVGERFTSNNVDVMSDFDDVEGGIDIEEVSADDLGI